MKHKIRQPFVVYETQNKMKVKLTLGFVITLVLTLSFASAAVGVGVSPSKVVEQMNSGDVLDIQMVFFNTGDNSLEVTISISGDLAEFTEVIPSTQIIEPEPIPHELPLKNGQTFIVRFSPPGTNKEITYSGAITAIGGATQGSTFGGNVGVSSKIELTVLPSKSIFSRIKLMYYLIFGSVVLLVFLVWFLKKKGLSINFKKNKK